MATGERDRLVELDRKHVWHPYTQMQDYAARDPVIVQRGEGVRLQDVDGRWYWDGVSSVWLNVHGHNVPEINRALADQLNRVAHSTLLGQANVPSIQLAERLARAAPRGLEHVFFSDNGSTANEAALKMALQFWNQEGHPEKRRVLSFEGGYHGDTLGAVSLAPVERFHHFFADQFPPPIQVPYPYTYRSSTPHDAAATGRAALETFEAALEENEEEIAAVFVEPLVQGVAGVVTMPSGFLRGIRRACTRHDVLLAADEVATGFGRTGRMWACDHENVAPDLLTCGKGLTGGYLPLAATLTTRRVYDAFLGAYAERKQFFHGHSFTGNQLGCATALANLDLLDALLPKLPERVDAIAAGLERFRDLAFVGDVRHQGFMVGLELVADKASKAPFHWEDRAGYVIAERARDLGLLVRPIGNVSIFTPPLASTVTEIETMLDLFYRAHADAAPALEALARRTLAHASGARKRKAKAA